MRTFLLIAIFSLNTAIAKGQSGGSASAIAVTPSSVAFGTVPVGTSYSQTIQLKNGSSSILTISASNVSAAGFAINNLQLPATLQAHKATSFNIVFSPATAGAAIGTLSLTTTQGTLQISLSGTGVPSSQLLSVSKPSLNFGDVTVGQTASENVTLANTGNSRVTVSAISVSGAGFGITGVSNGTTLNPGQTVSASVQFAPQSSATISGNITIRSNATNSPSTINVSGIGTLPYSVALSWQASTSPSVTGYNVYRSTVSGGPYSRVASSVTVLSYNDPAVSGNLQYFYVVTSLNSNGQESGYSNQISAMIP